MKTLLRYWVTSDWSAIRIAWGNDSTIGYLHGTEMHWDGAPPECLAIAARDCLLDQYEHGVPSCEYEGKETEAEMEFAVNHAWVARMAKTDDVLQGLREAGLL